jgi:hypothetical protein
MKVKPYTFTAHITCVDRVKFKTVGFEGEHCKASLPITAFDWEPKVGDEIGLLCEVQDGEFVAQEVWLIPPPTKEEIHDIQGYDSQILC